VTTKGEEKTCFLLAPIGNPRSEVRQRSDDIREFVVEPAAMEAGYTLVRADTITVPGNITTQIINLVLKAPLVIADLSGANPNVMYELAIRHAARKPVVHITTDPKHIPFDISAIRIIVVSIKTPAEARRSREAILEAIHYSEEHRGEIDTPVSAAFDVAAIQAALPGRVSAPLETSEPVLSALKDIDQRLRAVDYRLSRAKADEGRTSPYSRRVFIVHGHDGELKTELARFLERLEFEPVILHEQADRGATIFAKLAGEMADVGFAFVLLTPDDVGAKAAQSDDLRPRARQNVVFEHGLFVGHLEPSRVCALVKGTIDIPSDLHGVLYKPIPSDGSLLSIAFEIVKELRAAGYEVDANRL